MAKRKIREKIKKVVEKIKEDAEPQKYKNFETTDKYVVYELVEKGFKVKEVKNPFGNRTEKLYIFHDNEQKIRGALNE